jgi:radical SAM-linked protein
VTRLRLLYQNGAPIAFLAHLDLWRMFSRLVRRAGLPMVYSLGFHPRPHIAMGPPLPVGAMGDQEQCDLFLEEMTPTTLMERLKGLAPPGLLIHSAREIPEQEKALTAFPFRSLWRLEGEWQKVPEADWFTDVLARESILVHRHTPKTDKIFDLRPYLLSFCSGNDWLQVETVSYPSGGARLDEILHLLKADYHELSLHSICRKQLQFGPTI